MAINLERSKQIVKEQEKELRKRRALIKAQEEKIALLELKDKLEKYTKIIDLQTDDQFNRFIEALNYNTKDGIPLKDYILNGKPMPKD